MKQAFQETKFRADTLATISQANQIIETYEQQGYTLTLRQLYYQFVSRDLIENTERSYKRLGEIISQGRLAGLIDWEAIEDRTRSLKGNSHWDSPADIILASYQSFRIDKWVKQPIRVECWVEKDALVGVLERVCRDNDVNYFACRGYVSQSEMFVASQRLAEYMDNEQEVVILHLGDHDPSGIDMSRDIETRLDLFLEDYQGMFSVKRIALNRDQIDLYQPPPNPAKTTDARFDSYQALHGNKSWELDALPPNVISDLIEEHIQLYRDYSLWEEAKVEERQQRETLRQVSRNWPKVEALFQG